MKFLLLLRSIVEVLAALVAVIAACSLIIYLANTLGPVLMMLLIISIFIISVLSLLVKIRYEKLKFDRGLTKRNIWN